MKTIILSFLLSFSFLSFTANADNGKLPEDATALTKISSAKILSVGESFLPMSGPRLLVGYIKIRFPLGGCLDQLGPVFHKLIQGADGHYTLYLSAINIKTKGSMVAR
jgi:hypothetical protein